MCFRIHPQITVTFYLQKVHVEHQFSKIMRKIALFFF